MATKNFTALRQNNVAHLQVVRRDISHDVVEALEVLLYNAKRGNITGIAFACAMPNQRYITKVAGSCLTHPTFTRGMLDYLQDEVADLVHDSDPDGIR